MKPEYKRENLKITEFDKEDVITTSEVAPTESTTLLEHENRYIRFSDADQVPGSWF